MSGSIPVNSYGTALSVAAWMSSRIRIIIFKTMTLEPSCRCTLMRHICWSSLQRTLAPISEPFSSFSVETTPEMKTKPTSSGLLSTLRLSTVNGTIWRQITCGITSSKPVTSILMQLLFKRLVTTTISRRFAMILPTSSLVIADVECWRWLCFLLPCKQRTAQRQELVQHHWCVRP